MLVRIRIAARVLGVCAKTLRRWDQQRNFQAIWRTVGGHRRYSTAQLEALLQKKEETSEAEKNREEKGEKERVTKAKTPMPQRVVCYARVSSHKQRKDLSRQVQELVEYAQRQSYHVEAVYKDTASGLNDHRKGLLRLLDAVGEGWVDRVLVTYPDRLARFGTGFI